MLSTRDLVAGYDDRTVLDGLDLRPARRRVHRDRRAERLRQVDAAAHHGPAAHPAPAAPCCWTAPRSATCRPGRWPAGSACCRRARWCPRGSPSPTWSAAAGSRTSGGGGSGRPEDEAAVDEAMALADVTELADRPVDTLSGGQRQRVWIAMTLAQDTEALLLDEPTTFLDLAHQVEVLDLLHRLRTERGRTVVAVLHDLNQAARYADHLVAMRAGARGRRRAAPADPHRGPGPRRLRARLRRRALPGDRRAAGRARRLSTSSVTKGSSCAAVVSRPPRRRRPRCRH